MALAVNVASSIAVQTNASSFSWSHTCTGSNLYLVVGVSIRDTTTIPTDTSVSGITYNSVAMTKLISKVSAADRYTSLWGLVAPATGTNTVAVTLSTTYSRSEGGAISYTGAAQSNQPDASSSFDATAINPSNNLTTITDAGDVVDNIVVNGSVTMSGPSTGQTSVYNGVFSTSAAGMSYKTALTSPAGSTSMGWSTSASHGYSQVLVAIKPVVAATSVAGSGFLRYQAVKRSNNI